MDLTRSVFGQAIDVGPVRVHARKWAFFQPRNVIMAPDGAIWFHPDGQLYRDDFAAAPLDAQGLFIHEMTHVWQHQRGIYLPLRRHPFCRYAYVLKPGWPLARYGLEQQAEIVHHGFIAQATGMPCSGGESALTASAVAAAAFAHPASPLPVARGGTMPGI